MKTDLSMLKTTKRKTKVEIVNEVSAKSLSLDEIERLLEEQAQIKCVSLTQSQMVNDNMERLEKLANFKLKRLQLKALEQSNEPVEVQPIEVKFISSKTTAHLDQLEKIDREVRESLGIKQDA